MTSTGRSHHTKSDLNQLQSQMNRSASNATTSTRSLGTRKSSSSSGISVNNYGNSINYDLNRNVVGLQYIANLAAKGGDQESIYSFDSVGTNDRLLDRLGLDGDEYVADGLSKRDSLASVKTTERLLDRLGLDEPDDLENQSPGSNWPSRPSMQVPSSASVSRNPSSGTSIQRGNGPRFNNDSNKAYGKLSQKSASNNVTVKVDNRSSDSLQGDIVRAGSISHLNSISLPSTPDPKESELGFSSAPDLSISHYNDSQELRSSPSSLTSLSRTPSLPVNGSSSLIPSDNRRVFSDITSSSSGSNGSIANPETRLKIASQLRSVGKHREASYQTHIAASPPYNDSKAMYMYSMALRFGQGVKQSDRNSLAWLCKSILTTSYSNSIEFIRKLNKITPEDMLELIFRELGNDYEADPIGLFKYYSNIEKSQRTKIINSTKNLLNFVPTAYHELANALKNGWGLKSKNELHCIKLLSKAGSMGNINSMNELGEMYSVKTKVHKKDLYRAAAWLRLSELLGTKSIGNSWIYKDKYLQGK